jgi:hypothetical protein
MPRHEVTPRFRKHLPDLLAGLAVFALLIGLTAWHVGIAATSGGSVGAALDRNASAVLLAGAVTAIVVFNVAFVGHLRRAYAGPRKAAARHAENRPHT